MPDADETAPRPLPSLPRPRPSLRDWAELVRLPTVFTVIADVAAAFLFVAGGASPSGRFATVVAAGVALYWAGMVLNDLFDLDQDRRERSTRPLASGRIGVSAARGAGWGLLGVGVVLGAASGFVPAAGDDPTWLPAVIAGLLAVAIVAYDGPLKPTPAAAAAMGACRLLSFLLGAAAALPAPGVVEGPPIPRFILGIACGFGLYVMGITTVGRREAVGDRRIQFFTGLVVTTIGVAILAFAPRIAGPRPDWHVSTLGTFPLLIFLIAGPVIVRQGRLLFDAPPRRIQASVRVGVLTIIPLAAAFAFLGAGPAWGIAIFALVVPSLALASRFRVT